MKTQSELENEFAQIENEASLILKNIRDCIDREEAIPENTKNKYRETCAWLQKKSGEIYSQRFHLLDEYEKPPEKGSPQRKAHNDKVLAIDVDNWRVESMLNEIDSMLKPDAINIPQKYVKEVIAQLDKVLNDFGSFVWEPDENYRDFLKRNGMLYTIPKFKESHYIDSKFDEFNAEKKWLRDKINDYVEKYKETNNAGTRESLSGWINVENNKWKIVDFVYKYLGKISSTSDGPLYSIQSYRAKLAKDKDSLIKLKISKNNEEKTKRDAHDNENNVNFSLVIKDKATGETRTSSVAGGYPLGVEGILDTFKLDGNTNEQFKFTLEVEVTKTKRKFCWHDYEDLIQYFAFNQPLAKKGNKRELTSGDMKSATIDAIVEVGIVKTVEKGLEKAGVILSDLTKKAAMKEEESFNEIAKQFCCSNNVIANIMMQAITKLNDGGSYQTVAEELTKGGCKISKSKLHRMIQAHEKNIGTKVVIKGTRKDFAYSQKPNVGTKRKTKNR